MTAKFLLRLPDDLAEKADAAAAALELSRNQWITDLIAGELKSAPDPRAIVGYWEVSGGESPFTCVRCFSVTSTPPRVGVDASGRVFGPLCSNCAPL